jgi:tetratricopeptide (TPR) repeat protein
MTPQMPATIPGPTSGEGWLILKVALPRLARRLARIDDWLDRYNLERFAEAADELRGLGGAEGLGLLAAVPPDRRAAALELVELDAEDRTRLRSLTERLGDPRDVRSPAAALLRMVPSVEAASLEIPGHDPQNAAALIARGYQALEGGNTPLARELARKALALVRIADGSTERSLECDALNLQGLASGTLGKIADAIDSYNKVLRITREIGDRRVEGIALGNLGLAYANLGEVERAIGYHEQCLVIAREIGDRRVEGIALANLGFIHASLGQVDKAVD